MLTLDAEKLRETEDILTSFFSRRDSRRAVKALCDWLRAKGGRCTKGEMSGFSKRLECGQLGFRFSRTNFYRSILQRYLALGLIAESLQYDQANRKPVKGYSLVVQPITRPVSPSLPHLIHALCERWNRELASLLPGEPGRSSVGMVTSS